MGNGLTFEKNLQLGRTAEKIISGLLQEDGNFVIPSYDYNGSDGDKAPRMQGINSYYVVPDLDVASKGNRFWVEVKRYTHAVLNRTIGKEVHGIPRRNFDHYMRVQVETGCIVWIYIYETETENVLRITLDGIENNKTTCRCPSCKSGYGSCLAPIKRGIYWPREAMELVYNMSEEIPF